ncbi:hypothetical protein D1872_354530 [compost metagenome]
MLTHIVGRFSNDLGELVTGLLLLRLLTVSTQQMNHQLFQDQLAFLVSSVSTL